MRDFRSKLRAQFFSSRLSTLKMTVVIGLVFWSGPMILFAAWETDGFASFSSQRFLFGMLALLGGGAAMGVSFWALACLRWSSRFGEGKEHER